MSARDPDLESLISMPTQSPPLSEMVDSPAFQQGLEDARAKRPIANYSPLYLEGYRQGKMRPSSLIASAGA